MHLVTPLAEPGLELAQPFRVAVGDENPHAAGLSVVLKNRSSEANPSRIAHCRLPIEPCAPSPSPSPPHGGEGKAFSLERAAARDANSLPTEGREEVRVAGAAAQRGIRRAVEPLWASRSPVRRQAQIPKQA